MARGTFAVGEQVDPVTHARTGTAVDLESNDLTTHGVIVGMTGSGKTGLGVVLLEEALLAGIPALAIDPKGDLGNLALTFPDLSAAEFAPWVEQGQDPEQVAAAWREGLASWGLGPDRVRALRDAAAVTIYTPGSTAGAPLDLVGALRAPEGADPETVRDEVEGYVAGLLGLVGVDADPLSSRPFILLANLVEHAWSQGRDLDLATLVGLVADPPLRKLGVFELDTFFPPAERAALALRLNGLLASPAFAAWGQGEPLDLDRLLKGPDGRPSAAVVSLAHLDDAERQFAVAVLLGRLVTWMRRQPGTADLRLLVYFDEVVGFAPPVAEPPAKRPLLTLLKQARAYGVGLVLATQNPVDLDYRALGNAGTWLIGRLQTERDRDRLLDGLRAASGATDVEGLEATIAGLEQREFVLRQAGRAEPVLLTSRWALSYLRGPLTREQIGRLTATAPRPAPAAPAVAEDESQVAPPVADGIPTRWADPAAAWVDGAGPRLQAAVVARVRMLFDDDRAGLRAEQEWEAVLTPLGATPDVAAARAVDYDERDLRDTAPEGARYVLPEAPLDRRQWFTALERALTGELVRARTARLLRNPELGLWSRAGEPDEDFARRCEGAAAAAADGEAAKLRDRFETRLDRARSALASARDRVAELEVSARSRRAEEVVGGVGGLLGAFLGGRSTARGLARTVSGAAGRRGRAAGAGQRLASAQHRAEERAAAIADLEEELAGELLAIDRRRQDRAAAIEPLEVPLERTDVHVEHLALVWIPEG